MLKIVLFGLFLIASVACVQTENSSSTDADTYSEIGGSAGFTSVRAILSQNCASCHVYHTMSEEQLISAGVLVAGSPASSKIYYRLNGSTEGPGSKNMPSGGALSIADLNTIKAWVQAVQP